MNVVPKITGLLSPNKFEPWALPLGTNITRCGRVGCLKNHYYYPWWQSQHHGALAAALRMSSLSRAQLPYCYCMYACGPLVCPSAQNLHRNLQKKTSDILGKVQTKFFFCIDNNNACHTRCTWAGGTTEFTRIICWSCTFFLTYHVCLRIFDQIRWAFPFFHLIPKPKKWILAIIVEAG